MYAKIRLSNISNALDVNDAVLALFESQATTVAQWVAALLPATAADVDVANTVIVNTKAPMGWTVDYSSGITNSRNVLLKSPCKDSGKFKYVHFTNSTTTASIATGTARSGNTLTDAITASSYYTTAAIGTTASFEIHISVSARHLLISSVRLDTGVNTTSGVFEYVTNDGYFTETSPYCPVTLLDRLDLAANFTSGTRVFKLPRYKNLRAANYPDVTNQQGYWETPYSDDDFNPADNGGYDYIGTGTDRTPLLIPFGVCNRVTHAFVGGAISDLCDVYLGPTNVGGNYEETLIGTDPYMSIPINNNTKRLFVPRG